MIWNLVELPFLIAFFCSGFFFAFYVVRLRRHRRSDKHSKTSSFDGASLDPSFDFDNSFLSQVRSIEYWQPPMRRADNSIVEVLLDFLGADKMPVALFSAVFLFLWAVSGYSLIKLLTPFLLNPFTVLCLSIAGAFIFGGLLTRVALQFLWRNLPYSSRFAGHAEALIGCQGGAMDKITLEGGMAQVYDEKGNVHLVLCRIEPHGRVIQEGGKILIIGYDSQENFYLVKQNPFVAN